MSVPASRRVAKFAAGLALAAAAVSPVAPMLALPASAQAIRSHADPAAESFVQAKADQAISILANKAMPRAQKRAAFYTFVNQNADVPRITAFVLGRYRRQITPAQYQAFSEAFRDYADSVYEKRLNDYTGQKLTVTGSVARAPGDVVVSSQVAGGGYKGVPTVNWRVMKGADGGWKVVDVQAQGVWLALVEQQDFTSTLANHNGDINVLIGQLKAETSQNLAR